jgi:N-acetylglucosaminyldiphosphoundecaprenol N-acetyl-beta-D-mannosaminyltransferase
MLLLAKIYGYDLKERVYGPDLMIEFFKSDCNREYSHFFYGSIPSTLNQLRERLNLKFSNLEIAGFYSPPFRTLTEKEDAEIIKMINASCPDVLWVGLGCPKQQLWMHEHKDSLKVPVMIGVGAAFDFLAGTKKQAPRWMQRSGLEWLFRLLTEPKRLWRRYILGYAFFLYLICRELINGKLCLNLRKI